MRTITAQIPDQLAESLDHLAEQEGRSKSWLVREAILDYLAQQEEIQRLTMEGIESYRAGNVVDHEEARDELDQWGD